MSSLQAGNLQISKDTAAKFGDNIEPYCQEYIYSRLKRYEKVLTLAKNHDFKDVFRVALHIWDEGLFFEVHEYLEYHWLRSSGNSKKVLQAMIRAAGTYVHLEQGNMKGAGKMSSKAIDALEAGREFLPAYLNLDLLLSKLRNLDPQPPKLSPP